MSAVCLTFEIHLPVRLTHYSFFDIGECQVYEDDVRTFEALDRAVTELYLPALQNWHRSLREYGNDFRFALALSGIFIELCERFRPDVLDGIRKLADNRNVEFLNMPYYHSLASVMSPQEFSEQAMLHSTHLVKLTGRLPTAFRNTGLIYSDGMARNIEELGIQVIQAGAPGLLNVGQSPGQVYQPASCAPSMRLLPSPGYHPDDPFPAASRGPVSSVSITLDPDRTPAGDGGWLGLLKQIPERVLSAERKHFVTPTQAAGLRKPAALISSKGDCSALKPYDLSLWRGNEMQKDAMDGLFLLENQVKSLHDAALLRIWRILQDADQFSAMSTLDRICTPHAPGSPYDAYINFMNILTDLTERVRGKD